MNFRLRRRHLRTLAVIAPLAFVGLLLALDARSRNNDEVWDGVQPRAALETLGAIELKASSAAPPAWERDDLWEGAAIRTRLWRPEAQSGDDGFWLELTPLTALRRPDVLLYWLPDETGVTSRAGDLEARLGSAYLLGALRGDGAGHFRLPKERVGEAGHLILYSLAQAEEIARAFFPRGVERLDDQP
ncbi:MAG: hypothetical protein ACT4PU_06950 [Planctomycetota bacterium]